MNVALPNRCSTEWCIQITSWWHCVGNSPWTLSRSSCQKKASMDSAPSPPYRLTVGNLSAMKLSQACDLINSSAISQRSLFPSCCWSSVSKFRASHSRSSMSCENEAAGSARNVYGMRWNGMRCDRTGHLPRRRRTRRWLSGRSKCPWAAAPAGRRCGPPADHLKGHRCAPAPVSAVHKMRDLIPAAPAGCVQ